MLATGDDVDSPVAREIAVLGVVKFVALAVTFGATLISIRVITATYGVAEYGAVSLVATLVSLMPVADLGLGLAITNTTVRARLTRSTTKLRLSFSAVHWILSAIAITIVGASILASAFGLWPHLLGSSSLLLGDPDAYMPWYAALCGFWMVAGLGYRLLGGQGRTQTIVVLQATGPVLATAGTLAAAGLHAPLLTFAFIPVVGSIVASGIGYVLAFKHLGYSSLGILPPHRIRAARFQRTLSAGLSGLFFTLGGLLMFSLDRLLLSQFGTPHALGQYAIGIPLFSAAQSALGSVGTYLWPRYSMQRMAGELTRSVVLRHTLVFGALGIAIGAALVGVSPTYTAIVGAEITDIAFIIALAAVAALQASLLPATSALTTERLLRDQGLGLLGALLMKILLAYLLIPTMGAAGVMVATAAGLITVQIPVAYLLLGRLSRDAPGIATLEKS